MFENTIHSIVGLAIEQRKHYLQKPEFLWGRSCILIPVIQLHEITSNHQEINFFFPLRTVCFSLQCLEAVVCLAPVWLRGTLAVVVMAAWETAMCVSVTPPVRDMETAAQIYTRYATPI